jgi:hypothetical protein
MDVKLPFARRGCDSFFEKSARCTAGRLYETVRYLRCRVSEQKEVE